MLVDNIHILNTLPSQTTTPKYVSKKIKNTHHHPEQPAFQDAAEFRTLRVVSSFEQILEDNRENHSQEQHREEISIGGLFENPFSFFSNGSPSVLSACNEVNIEEEPFECMSNF